jgi:hypothetical protein
VLRACCLFNRSSLSLCCLSSMSSIVTGILSSTVGLLANKVRDSTAAKLKDGGVTDTKIRVCRKRVERHQDEA